MCGGRQRTDLVSAVNSFARAGDVPDTDAFLSPRSKCFHRLPKPFSRLEDKATMLHLTLLLLWLASVAQSALVPRQTAIGSNICASAMQGVACAFAFSRNKLFH